MTQKEKTRKARDVLCALHKRGGILRRIVANIKFHRDMLDIYEEAIKLLPDMRTRWNAK